MLPDLLLEVGQVLPLLLSPAIQELQGIRLILDPLSLLLQCFFQRLHAIFHPLALSPPALLGVLQLLRHHPVAHQGRHLLLGPPSLLGVELEALGQRRLLLGQGFRLPMKTARFFLQALECLCVPRYLRGCLLERLVHLRLVLLQERNAVLQMPLALLQRLQSPLERLSILCHRLQPLEVGGPLVPISLHRALLLPHRFLDPGLVCQVALLQTSHLLPGLPKVLLELGHHRRHRSQIRDEVFRLLNALRESEDPILGLLQLLLKLVDLPLGQAQLVLQPRNRIRRRGPRLLVRAHRSYA